MVFEDVGLEIGLSTTGRSAGGECITFKSTERRKLSADSHIFLSSVSSISAFTAVPIHARHTFLSGDCFVITPHLTCGH